MYNIHRAFAHQTYHPSGRSILPFQWRIAGLYSLFIPLQPNSFARSRKSTNFEITYPRICLNFCYYSNTSTEREIYNLVHKFPLPKTIHSQTRIKRATWTHYCYYLILRRMLLTARNSIVTSSL